MMPVGSDHKYVDKNELQRGDDTACTLACTDGLRDPDLKAIVAAWHRLAPDVRRAIGTLVASCSQ
jgi:hypothetical protein